MSYVTDLIVRKKIRGRIKKDLDVKTILRDTFFIPGQVLILYQITAINSKTGREFSAWLEVNSRIFFYYDDIEIIEEI